MKYNGKVERKYVSYPYRFSLGIWGESWGIGIAYGWNDIFRVSLGTWDFCWKWEE